VAGYEQYLAYAKDIVVYLLACLGVKFLRVGQRRRDVADRTEGDNRINPGKYQE
jgi:hypothetical protein